METLTQSWLNLQCQQIQDVRQGLVILGNPEIGPFRPAAIWPPENKTEAVLSKAGQEALETREVKTLTDSNQDTAIAIPFIVNGQLYGAIAISINPQTHPQPDTVIRLLQWGSTWFELLLKQKVENRRDDSLFHIIKMVTMTLKEEGVGAASTALVTELASELQLERVSLGLLHKKNIQICAISHTAKFDHRTQQVESLSQAMEEAVDLKRTIIFPQAETNQQFGRMHQDLCKQHNMASVCTIPLIANQQVIGAITIESATEKAVDVAIVKYSEQTASIVAPVLDLKRREERSWFQRVTDGLRNYGKRLLGRGNLKTKTASIVSLFFGFFLLFAEGDFDVTAKASLVGRMQQMIVAPQQGFIDRAHVRAGDSVKEGDALVSFDDKELNLERLKWVGQREQHLKEYSAARAKYDRAETHILRALIDQSEAEIKRLDLQLSRTKLLSPFNGFVVEGDLSQSLGAPVERGEILFRLALLDAYRVIVEVDERDIRHIQVGQSGRLALSALPGEVYRFHVEKITPILMTEEGRNFFHVEGELEQSFPVLRPGMGGISKVSVGEQKLAWIIFRRFTEWLSLALWSFMP